MKILRVISSINPSAGGPINGLINSSIELVKFGHEIDVLSLDDPHAPWVKNFQFPVESFKGVFGAINYSGALAKWLALHVKNYDVVVIHGLWQFHSFATAKACKVNNIPYVTFTHGMLDPWFNLNNKIKTLKKNIYWKLFEQFTINNSNAVLFTSDEERNLASKSFKPYSANEIVVAYGCSQSSISREEATRVFYSNFPALQNMKFTLFMSRIHEKKGIDLLIKAISSIETLPSDYKFVIAGPDNSTLKPKLERMIRNLGVEDRIVWVGMLEGDAKWGAYHAAECFILPSHQENFGIVVAEALSTATPVLITNKVNIWREIKTKGAGFIENDDVQGVQSLLEKWFELSETEKQLMSEKAINCYENNFSIESASSDLEKILIEVASQKTIYELSKTR